MSTPTTPLTDAIFGEKAHAERRVGHGAKEAMTRLELRCQQFEALTQWQPISTAPKGKILVAADTDNGLRVDTVDNEGDDYFSHEGEYTFQHGYYFSPKYWLPLPPAPTAALNSTTPIP